MAIAVGPFDIWLTDKLTSLSPDFDTEVFVSYIISILDTDSPLEEKTESIQEILSQVLVRMGLDYTTSILILYTF